MVDYPVPKDVEAVDIPDSMSFPLNCFALPKEDLQYLEYIMLTEGLIKDRADRLAQQIFQAYKDAKATEVHVLVMMNGAFQFYTHLSQALNRIASSQDHRIYFIPQFFKVSSYKNTQSLGVVTMDKPPSLAGKHVLVVEDIYDTGHSM